jgi:hypothetical protein
VSNEPQLDELVTVFVGLKLVDPPPIFVLVFAGALDPGVPKVGRAGLLVVSNPSVLIKRLMSPQIENIITNPMMLHITNF